MKLGTFKTECKNGHPLSGDNLYIYKRKETGKVVRACRTCRTMSSKLRKRNGAPTPKRPNNNPREVDPNEEAVRVITLTNMQQELERETRQWVRKELKKRIAEYIRSGGKS